MSIEMARSILLWCTVINYAVLVIWFLLYVLAHGWLCRLWGRWFRLTAEQDAVEPPAGADQLIDEVELRAGLGLVVGQVGFAKGAELLRGFVSEDELVGGESVGEAGGAGAGAALGGDGSAGSCAVGARGIDASLGRHGASWERGACAPGFGTSCDESNLGGRGWRGAELASG